MKMKYIMKIEIISPEKIEAVYEDVTSIILPGLDGSFGVLKNHAPMVALLKHGDIKITTQDKQFHEFRIAGGMVEIKENQITIILH